MGIYSKTIDLQKMMSAWEKVYKNKPAKGVDNITCEEFEANKKEELKQLQIELKEHRYEVQPVKKVTIYKDEKAREIGISSMRDKVVQQSVAIELSRIYEPCFSKSAYAYRSGYSALTALDKIEKYIQGKDKYWVLKLDIEHFFDNVSHSILLGILKQKIHDADMLNLIKDILETSVISEDGEIIKNKKGILQGSSCSPILSNIYLLDFDLEMEKISDFYIRYSDDIFIIGRNRERITKILDKVKLIFEKKNLNIKQSKTVMQTVKNEFDFLGYTFSSHGKKIPRKAEVSLESRLETMWLTSGEKIDKKLKKGQEILGGWEQYYRDEREIGSIIEFVVAISMLKGKSDDFRKKIEQSRNKFNNIYKDILEYFVLYWNTRLMPENILYEYEDYLEITADNKIKSYENKALLKELIQLYSKFLINPTEDLYSEIMQLYTDLGEYEKASMVSDMKNSFMSNKVNRNKIKFDENKHDSEYKWNESDISLFINFFIGREDTYAIDNIFENSRNTVEQVMEPVNAEVIKRHFMGEITAATYVQRSNSTSKYMVMDIDISKKVLILHPYGSEEFKSYKEKALDIVKNMESEIEKLGLKCYIEDTGHRGYHMWLFFGEWIPVRYIHMLADYIQKNIFPDEEDISIEIFPNKTRIKEGKPGQAIKIPLGYHTKTGNKSCFLDDDFHPVSDYHMFLDSVAVFGLKNIRKLLGKINVSNNTKQRELDTDISIFGKTDEAINQVLSKCNLMRYLCQKAYKTGYLSHFERLSVLYVFGHMGDNGKEFVHTVMSYTLNYQYSITQKFISKIPAKPVSCIKLREQYKMITAEYGCNCNFRRTKNCYPSPVLHAIKNADSEQGEVTIPTSRTITKEKERVVYDEINIHKKANVIAAKILEYKKQKRGIDKNIERLEDDLQNIFENAGIDCLEIEIGMLVRRKKENGEYEWIIEI